MMNTSSKTILLTFLGMMFVATLLTPAHIFAQEQSPRGRGGAQGTFCANLNEIVARIDQRIADREAQLLKEREKHSQKLTEHRNTREQQRRENRSRRGINREEHYAKLEARAVTDAQKQAVATFKATVEAAVAKRTSAVDAAIQSFQQSIDQSIAERRLAIDAALHTFRSARTAAIEQARADCAAQVDPKTIRENFRSAMKAAQEQLQRDRKAIGARSLEPIRIARKQALEQAIADFRATMEEARTTLKAAFAQ